MSPRKVLIDVISAFFEYRLRTKSCLLPKISSEKYYLNSVGVNDFFLSYHQRPSETEILGFKVLFDFILP
jgi:hypothetical protein